MRAPLFCTIVIAAFCVACAGPYPPQGAPKSRYASLHPFTAVCAFTDVPLAMITDLNYDPTTLVPPASTPITATSLPINTASPEYLDLQSSFNRAPNFLKNQLCGLASVYIIPSGSTFSNSWGFRDPTNLNNRYVGISHDLWGANPLQPIAISLTTYETNVVNALLLGMNNPPYFDNAYPNDGAMMLLSVLAHEFGHVLWTDIFIASPGSDPNFATFCPGVFPTASWYNTSATPIKWTKWRAFGDVADTATDIADPSDPYFPSGSGDDPSYKEIKVRTLKQLISNGTPGSLKKAHKVVVRLLNSTLRPWPSLFGAFSANEDFVETFTLYVLTQATPKLTNLEMAVPLPSGNVPIDIPNTITTRPLLAAKLLCFDDYLLHNPP